VSVDELIARIEADIEEHGFFAQHVIPTVGDPDPDAPSFTYTVGMRAHGHPDLLVSGMTGGNAWDTLAQVAHLVRGGARFGDGDVSERVLDGSPVRFVAIPEDAKREHLAITAGFYGDEPFEALQIVFPDSQNRWPWEDGSQAVPQDVLGEITS
jgi:Domain of unknown function (DUF4262)